ncbi:unnamed protein product [Oikopleura dioica]|nr:unnamed protein product [Oikopleura dioica]
MIPDLFLAAHFLHCHVFLDALTKKVFDLVQKCASFSPILFLFGEEMMLDDLTKAAFDAMKRDPLSAASSEDFSRLPLELLEELIVKNYDCKEADMLKAALLWVKGNFLSPVDAVDLLRLFRPALISKREMERLDSSGEFTEYLFDLREEFNAYNSNLAVQPLIQKPRTRLRCEERLSVQVEGIVCQTPVRMRREHLIDAMSDATIDREHRHLIDPAHVVLEFNGFIYVLGEYRAKNSLQPTKVSKRFDPRTGTWFEIAPMNQSRSSFAAVACGEFIYVFGGKRRSHGLRACERYCPRTNSWKNIAQLPAALWQHSAVAINDAIYISGGNTKARGEVKLDVFVKYDPKLNKFTKMAELISERVDHTMAVIDKNQIAILGGRDPSENAFCSTVEIYDIKANRWMFYSQIRPFGPLLASSKLNYSIVDGDSGEKLAHIWAVDFKNSGEIIEFNFLTRQLRALPTEEHVKVFDIS